MEGQMHRRHLYLVGSQQEAGRGGIPAFVINDSLQSVVLGTAPAFSEGEAVAAISTFVSREGDTTLQASAAIVKTYFLQVANDLRMPELRRYTSAPVGAIEFLSGKKKGEDSWLRLLRKAVVKDVESAQVKPELSYERPLTETNRTRGERLSTASIEEIVKIVLAANDDRFSMSDLQFAGIARDVVTEYPGGYMGLRARFNLPENPRALHLIEIEACR